MVTRTEYLLQNLKDSIKHIFPSFGGDGCVKSKNGNLKTEQKLYYYRKKGIRIVERWFEAKAKLPQGADLEIVRRAYSPIAGCINSISHTLLTDLKDEEEKIWQQLGSANRYEARRAESKDLITSEVSIVPKVEELKTFLKYYNDFCTIKGITNMPREGVLSLERYRSAGSLVFTRALHKGVALVWHLYYHEGTRCRLLNSASLYRANSDTVERALVGRSNRFLHWQDMRLFKAQGIEYYDWGGFDPRASKDLISINKFKQSFGGIEAQVYDGKKARSYLGKALLLVHQIIRKTKNDER